jgi:hypothetical protein
MWDQCFDSLSAREAVFSVRPEGMSISYGTPCLLESIYLRSTSVPIGCTRSL